MQYPTSNFILLWSCTCIVGALVIGAFNAIVDPYAVFNTPDISKLNARKPAAALTYQRIAKSYDAVRFEPKSVILGSSRVNVGLDARHSAWPLAVRPTYNLGFLDGGPYLSFRYLQHVTSGRDLALVVMGLDFEYFLRSKDDMGRRDYLNTVDYESRLAVDENGAPNQAVGRQQLVDALTVFAFSGMKDSIATVYANLEGRGLNVVDGRLYGYDDWIPMFHERFSLYFSRADLFWIRWLHEYSTTARVSELSMTTLREILNLCESRGTRVILFINPVHADQLEIYERAGLWPVFEDWKRQLTLVAGQYTDARHRGDISLWDFSGYHNYSTESLGRFPMSTYSDPSHYTPVVGEALITRIFGGGDARFGVLLVRENVEAHLAAIRMQQRLYHEQQRGDARRIHDLYDVAVRDLLRARRAADGV